MKSNFLKNKKTLTLIKNIGLTSIYRGISAAINFITVPIILNILGVNNYGVWMTISTLLGWLIFFDFGISAGLQNKIANSIARGQIKKTKILVSSTYALISIILIFVSFILIIVSSQIKWSDILNTPVQDNIVIFHCVFIITISISSQLILKLLSSVFFAYQKTNLNELITCITQGVILLATIIISGVKSVNSLLLVTIIQGFIPVAIWLTCNIYFFRTQFIYVSPSFRYINFSFFKGIVQTSSNFFMIQMYALIIFSTDNILVARLFTPADVTVFNIVTKYFSIIGIFFGVLLIPYWSAIAQAYALNDMNWIIKTIKANIFIWASMIIVAIFMLIFTKPVIHFWTNQDLEIPESLSLTIACYTIVQGYNNIFGIFLNVANKFKIQIIVISFIIITNIPLSYLLVRNLNLGLAGIVISNLFCVSTLGFFMTIQSYKVLTNRSNGIWDR